MDVAVLLGALEATLDAQPERRREAEGVLTELSRRGGCSTTLLQAIATGELQPGVRQAAAIFFKNLVARSWSVPEPFAGEERRFELAADDKAVVRANLLDAVATAPPRLRLQLVRAVTKVVECDYPEHWPDLLPKICAYLASGDPTAVFAALQCLLEIVRKYEMKSMKDLGPLEPVISSSYPLLLQLLGQCVSNPTPAGGDAARFICKIVHATIAFNLPKPLRVPATLQPWISALLHIVSLPVLVDPQQRHVSERHKFSWWNAKKWACRVLNGLFERYGNENVAEHVISKKEKKQLKEFGRAFYHQVVPTILQTYLKELDFVRQGQYLSPRVLHAILSFLSDSVQFGEAWKMIKPFMMAIVREVVFPLLCFSDADMEKWEEDPTDYVRSQLSIDEDMRSPAIAGKTMLYKLVQARKDNALIPILQLCQEVLGRYLASPPAARNHREKDGALHMIKSLASILADREDFAPQLEQLMLVHVLPEVDSPMPFLRLRAIDLVGALSDTHFPSETTIVKMLQVVLPHLTDPELPVLVQTALTIGSLIDREELTATVRSMVGDIMHVLLRLNSEYELEEASYVMDKLIEAFTDEMIPFAQPICAALCDSFLRMIGDEGEEQAGGGDDEDGISTRGVTAMVTLRSILVLVRAMDDTPEVLVALESTLMPLIDAILRPVYLDYFDEVCEIAAALTYTDQKLSPSLWHVYELLYHAFKSGAVDYFKEMMPALDNFVTQGEDFLAVPARMAAMIDMITTVMTSEHLGEEDRATGCEMMEVMLLALRGHIDTLVPQFITSAMAAYEEADYRHLIVSSLKVVLNAIYYNAALAVDALHKSGLLARFFQAWLERVKLFNRVSDKKLGILALCALYTLPFDSLPPAVQGGYALTVGLIVELFKTLPQAYEVRRAYEDYMTNGLESSDEEDEGGDGQDGEGGEGEGEDAAQPQDPDGDAFDKEDDKYMRYLARKLKRLSPLKKLRVPGSQGMDDEDGEDSEDEEGADEEDEYDVNEEDDEDALDEDLAMRTPLDLVDEYVVFAQTFRGLAQSNPRAWAVLSAGVSAEHNAVLTEALATADQHVAEASAAAG